MNETLKNPYAGRFQPETNFKKVFEDEVTQLKKQNIPLEWRNHAVEQLTDAYIEQTRQIPDGVQLHRLANYILQDDLRDQCPDKITRTDFPFLSRGQIQVRMKRETPTGDMGYFSSTGKRPRIKPKKYRHMQ
ncbi:hypothetical protein H1S01_20645, partial [Heliobacterium chlorum]